MFIATSAVVFIVKDMSVLNKGAREASNLLADLKNALHNKGLLYIMAMFFVVQTCIMLIQPLITLYVGELMHDMGDAAIKMSGVVFSLSGITGILAARFGENAANASVMCAFSVL